MLLGNLFALLQTSTSSRHVLSALLLPCSASATANASYLRRQVDLLPEGTNLAAVGDWLLEAVARKKLR